MDEDSLLVVREAAKQQLKESPEEHCDRQSLRQRLPGSYKLTASILVVTAQPT